MKKSKRDFIKKTLSALAAVSLGGILSSFGTKNYASIIGVNKRIKVGIMGMHARGLALSKNYAQQKNCGIIYFFDVGSESMTKCINAIEKIQNKRHRAAPDFSKALENKSMDFEYPTSVSSSAGRYRYKDDWQTPDTQVVTWEFPDNKLIDWKGQSCNGRDIEGSSVGEAFCGEKGTVVIDGGNSSKIYDLKINY